jgi:hypothetical protein
MPVPCSVDRVDVEGYRVDDVLVNAVGAYLAAWLAYL